MAKKAASSPGSAAAYRPMALGSGGYFDTAFIEDAAIRGMLDASPSEDSFIYFDNSGDAAVGNVSAAGLTLLAAADAAAQLDELGGLSAAAPVLAANLDCDGWAIDNVGSPTNGDSAVSQDWVTTYVAGQVTALAWKVPVRAAQSGAFVQPYTYNNGAKTITFNSNGALETIDGKTLVNGNRLLVWEETGGGAVANGIYEVTVIGSGGAAAVLTRASDFDDMDSMNPMAVVAASEGTTYGNKQFQFTNDAPFTIGTDGITWVLFSAGVDNATNPSALGSAAPGNSSVASPANHVHPTTGLILATGSNDFTGQQTFKAIANEVSAEKTANYSVGSNDHKIQVNATSGAVTITLPQTPTNGRAVVVWFKKGGNVVTVQRHASSAHNMVINGSNETSVGLSLDEMATFTYWGTNEWSVE